MGNNDCSNLRIGIPIIGIKDWLGGVTYIELLVKAVSMLPEGERPKMFLVMNEGNFDALDLHSGLFPIVDDIFFIGPDISGANKLLSSKFRQIFSYEELFSEIDFFFPVLSNVLPHECSASWIPDFQHFHLPEFFSAGELKFRNDRFQQIAAFAKLVVLSSKAAEKDFRNFFPDSKSAVRILSFHTIMHDDLYSADPVQMQLKYHLPDEFIICSNQFWAHKNHLLLFEALAELYHAGQKVHMVCTGSTSDYRFPGYFMEVKQRLIKLEMNDYVHILGVLPRNDQLQLMRRASAVVQPSLFEGWSTVVEDARALGKTVILSDLDVHKEQMGNNAVYFERNSRSDLVQIMSRVLPELKPGPDPLREQQARIEARVLVKAYALQFCTIAREAQFLFGRHLREPLSEAGTQELSSYEISGPSAGAGDAAKIKVSAIVSTYNAERFIRGCLEDLLAQTLYQQGGLEIIVVDSGSQQNERAVVAEFQKKYRSITYIRTAARETVYAAWNRGIKTASGQYITNANTDDRHRKDALEVMAYVLENNPGIGLVYADVIITETENETFDKHTPAGAYQWLDYDRELLSVGCFMGPQPMWRIALHGKYGYFDETFSSSGDWEFWLRIAEDTAFLHIPEFLGLYLRSPHSLEHQNTGNRIKEDRINYKTYIPKYLPAYKEYFTHLLGSDLSDRLNVYRYGQILAAFDTYDEAIRLYASFLQKNPKDEGFNFLLADLKNMQAQHSADHSPPPLPLPEEIMAYLNQADRHIGNNNLASAREAIKHALQYTSEHPHIAAMLSNMLTHLESAETANQFLGTEEKDHEPG
jgi:glycosyltransferase involved in cell wall biosynthesis